MSNTYRKLSALGILALLLATAWMLLGEPYFDLWQDRIAQAERLQRKQMALSQLIRNSDLYQQQYQAISGSQGLQQVFLDDKSGALADVKLQRIVKQIVNQSGAKLMQAVIKKTRQGKKSASASESKTDKSVTVKVVMQGSLQMIYSALQALENNRPLILVDNLEIIHVKARYRVAQSGDDDTFYRASYDARAFIL
ncbi:MAG: type II secretion system protein GspM [Gammaproteobacteria bacterium]|nr:type II secretion system protein GspM [Gammaproteobacteria bacterium]